MKIKRRFKGQCNGKKKTFRYNKGCAQLKKEKKPKQARTEANESTTSISTPNVPSDDESGAYGGYNSCDMATLNKDHSLYGFGIHQLGATASSEDEYAEYRKAFEEFACKCTGEDCEMARENSGKLTQCKFTPNGPSKFQWRVSRELLSG